METTPVDALRRTLTSSISRRGVLATLTSGLFSAGILNLAESDAEARKKGKRKNKKRQNKNKKQNRRNKAKTRLDATCPGAGEAGFRHRAGDIQLAQTFTAVRSGALVKATLPITNESGSAGDIVLRLSPLDGSGLPTDEVLAETSAAVDAPPEAIVELEFDFSDPFTVEAGVDYALVLLRPAGDDFIWRGEVGNPCGGNVAARLEPAELFFLVDEELDLLFTTFVRS